ncbi:unnamed protein product, partial [marine sediment metagenome]
MGRMYSAEFENVAVTAAQDFFELLAADDKPIAIHAVYLSQSSDVGDSEEEMLRVKIIRGNATSGSGGSSSTPAPLNPADTAAGTTVEVNNTTEASTGTEVDIHCEAFNVRTGFAFIPTPEMRPIVSEGAGTMIVV